jgi:hypothetical protein
LSDEHDNSGTESNDLKKTEFVWLIFWQTSQTKTVNETENTKQNLSVYKVLYEEQFRVGRDLGANIIN